MILDILLPYCWNGHPAPSALQGYKPVSEVRLEPHSSICVYWMQSREAGGLFILLYARLSGSSSHVYPIMPAIFFICLIMYWYLNQHFDIFFLGVQCYSTFKWYGLAYCVPCIQMELIHPATKLLHYLLRYHILTCNK